MRRGVREKDQEGRNRPNCGSFRQQGPCLKEPFVPKDESISKIAGPIGGNRVSVPDVSGV